MNQTQNTYTLDFVLPRGETGPIGPPSITSMIYIDFQNYNNTGIIPISNNTILPNNSTTFNTNNNTITITENGTFEFTFCGLLKTPNNTANIQLISQTSNNIHNIMSIELLPELNQIYFSQTKIKSCNPNENIYNSSKNRNFKRQC